MEVTGRPAVVPGGVRGRGAGASPRGGGVQPARAWREPLPRGRGWVPVHSGSSVVLLPAPAQAHQGCNLASPPNGAEGAHGRGGERALRPAHGGGGHQPVPGVVCHRRHSVWPLPLCARRGPGLRSEDCDGDLRGSQLDYHREDDGPGHVLPRVLRLRSQRARALPAFHPDGGGPGPHGQADEALPEQGGPGRGAGAAHQGGQGGGQGQRGGGEARRAERERGGVSEHAGAQCHNQKGSAPPAARAGHPHTDRQAFGRKPHGHGAMRMCINRRSMRSSSTCRCEFDGL
mmetsp:Transcript_10357/g.33452  ORF Transcript_10357/g.33452 Transcript_10357/m.33452 type:complete len:288 (+) Transcript_10357:201-1064(+)